MGKCKFFVITRFNIATDFVEGGEAIVNVDPSRDIKYLTERFRLFEKYTFCSMERQKSQDFTWFVLFSDKIPENFKKKIESMKHKMSNFKALFLSIDEAKNLGHTMSTIISQYDADFYITTRLDNDDAVSSDFMKGIVQHVENLVAEYQGNGFVLFYKYGIQYNESRNIACYFKQKKNHFTTLVYPKSKRMQTILSYNHGFIDENFALFEITTKDREPMWIEIIHETNYANITHQSLSNTIISTSRLKGFDSLNIIWNWKDLLRNSIFIFLAPFARRAFLVKRYGLKNSVSRIIGKCVKTIQKYKNMVVVGGVE